METSKRPKADIITTILGSLIVLWVVAVYTYSLFVPDMEFGIQYVVGFLLFATFLIWFKGENARAVFEKYLNRKIPPKKQ